MPTLGLAKQDLWSLGAVGESFWQKESLLQYTITLLQGPKDPVLPTLMYVAVLVSMYDVVSRYSDRIFRPQKLSRALRFRLLYAL